MIIVKINAVQDWSVVNGIKRCFSVQELLSHDLVIPLLAIWARLLRGQLVKCLTALFSNIDIFAEKNARRFCTKVFHILFFLNIGVFEI